MPRKVEAIDDVALEGEQLGRVPHGREARVRPVAVEDHHHCAGRAAPGGTLEPVHRELAIFGAQADILGGEHRHAASNSDWG